MTNGTSCYKEDGTESSDIPCGFSNLSSCCGSGWDCLSNGLCREHGTTAYSQSTCTDPTYQKCLSFCNQSQFDGYTEVSRCESNGNSWCCAGASGQDLGGSNCCDTTLTTALEPYPFSTIDSIGESTTVGSSVSSSATPTTSITSGTTFTSASSSSSSLGTSVRSISQTTVAASTQTRATTSKTSTSSPAQQPTDLSHNSKTGIEIGIPIAIVVVLLAILAFFVFQNRKFRQRLLQLRSQMGEGSPGREDTTPEMQELDLTHYELTQHDAPKHEVLGNGIHELYHNGVEHELVGDGPRN